jgi:CBS domain-containing protein
MSRFRVCLRARDTLNRSRGTRFQPSSGAMASGAVRRVGEFMLVKEVMTKGVVSVSPRSSVARAIDLMARSRLSGLPVIDESRSLVGIITEADFLRRPEIGTLGHEAPWYASFFFPGNAAEIYAHTHGRRVDEVMSSDVATIDENANLDDAIALMQKRRVKRLPVVADGKVIGIIARADFVRALALSAGQSHDDEPTTDGAIKHDIEAELRARPWAPVASVDVQVEDGKVTLLGVLTDDRQRAAVRAVAENVNGVVAVDDQMKMVDLYLMTPLV